MLNNFVAQVFGVPKNNIYIFIQVCPKCLYEKSSKSYLMNVTALIQDGPH